MKVLYIAVLFSVLAASAPELSWYKQNEWANLHNKWATLRNERIHLFFVKVEDERKALKAERKIYEEMKKKWLELDAELSKEYSRLD